MSTYEEKFKISSRSHTNILYNVRVDADFELKIVINLNTISEWTPIFNSTTYRYNVGDFHVKFTQHKKADKNLYLSMSVDLYNNDGVRVGYTNFIFYATRRDYGFRYSAYKRYYFDGPYSGYGCQSGHFELSYLAVEGFNFEMITAVRSPNMYQFIVSGEKHNETMADCSNYDTWQEMLEEATSVELRTIAQLEDLSDYFTTEYKVVY